jgi:hypothetical protein
MVIVLVYLVVSYHLRIIAKGETTFEQIKKVYATTTNPKDNGVFGNYAQLCCSSVPESVIPNLSEEISAAQYMREALPEEMFNELFYNSRGKLDNNAGVNGYGSVVA